MVRLQDHAFIMSNIKVHRLLDFPHLGYHLSENIYKFDASKCVFGFNKQRNIFVVNCKNK